MSGFLDSMIRTSRARVDAASRLRPLEEVEESILATRPPRPLRDFGIRFDLVAEVKPRSPAEGALPGRDPEAASVAYEQGGAGMISVLTEPSAFGGSLSNLRRVSQSVGVPVLAKDFLVDPYQVYEAREAGADGVLLIARIVSDESLAIMLATVAGLDMFTLLEAFDHEDLERAAESASGRHDVVIGVNCRDLDTLAIVPKRHRDLAGNLPTGQVAVAESGMRGPEDIERVAALGYGAALVGTALMKSGDATATVRSMLDAGRRVASVAG
jgi:indole-3-glycerol phosphate synthase